MINRFRKTQACDRCRLKKIKCDGLQPRCSACEKIHFTCKISDKLARRGFPKGYTEALEKELIRLQTLLKVQHETTAILDFPFINDTFHRFNNYCNRNDLNQQIFLGHRTWANLFHTEEVDNSSAQQPILQNIITQHLHLANSNLPFFLIQHFKNNSQLNIAIVENIRTFFNRQNSLIPLLYPFDTTQDSLIAYVSNPTSDPLSLLILLYIIQFNWNCLDQDTLFHCTKLVVSTNVRSIQLLNLATYYFMTQNQEAYVTVLLNHTYSLVLSMGLYINPKNLHSSTETNDETDSVYNVTFWCFQFLNSWWSLIQGLPKTNFLTDEFQPKDLNIPILTSFNFLVKLVVKSLDGINLLLVLTNTEKSKLIYTLENFRKLLQEYKLYHNYHDEIIPIEKTDIIEIQLTLMYLVLTLITTLTDNPTQLQPTEEICYEILTLYLLLLQDTPSTQPHQLNVLNFLPLNNSDIINTCLLKLNEWATGNSTTTQQNYWKFNKYKNFLQKWVNSYGGDLSQQPFFKTYKLETIQSNNTQGIEEYMTRVREFNTTVIKTNSISIFSNRNSNTNFSTLFKNLNSPKLTELIQPDPQNQNIDNSLYLLSPLLGAAQEETDEGYAEDDDEDSSDNMEPLEIPFKTKRASLFDQQNLVVPQTKKQKPSGPNYMLNTANLPPIRQHSSILSNNPSITSISQLLTTDIDPKKHSSITLPKLPEVETPRTFVNMLLLSPETKNSKP